MRIRNGALLALIFFHSSYVFAQTISSPYTNYGIGETNDFSLQHNTIMGGLGIGSPENLHINTLNPAWSVRNYLTTFQVGFTGDFRNYSDEEESFTNQTGGLRYMAISFPLKRLKWVSNVSLLPFSTVEYDIVGTDVIPETNEIVQNDLSGSGGLSQLSWSHGIKIYKDFSLGLRATYIFGAIFTTEQNAIFDDTQTTTQGFSVRLNQETNYRDLAYGVSFAGRYKIADGRFLNFGAIYDLPAELQGERSSEIIRGNASALILDQGMTVSYQLPSTIGVGFSYDRPNKLVLGLDVSFRNWEGVNTEDVWELRNTLNIALGGKWVPDFQSVNSYLQRVVYRFGINFNQVPYIINDTRINEFGINFGVSLPVSSVSNLDVGFRFGQRGTTDNNLLREDFVQVVFGLTINDRWFIKRRFD